VKVSLRWLAELVDLPASTDALLERLTLGGLEIEGIERIGPDLSGLRVGQVQACGRHPNADRLSLCRVDAGLGEPLEVVCGAPNVAAGQKVAFAPPGSTLPDGTRLEPRKLRGVVSHGMICSARELGLGDDAAGILVLDAAAPVGAPLASVLDAGDTVVEVEITPNRGDWASMLGLAREVRAHFGGALRLPPCEPPEAGAAAAAAARLSIEDAEGCPRYVARVVRGVRVAPSPRWLADRLAAAGLRSLNAVVDVTNLVLLELGQPLHAFDLAALRGGEVRVRRAGPGEKLVTLDGQTRSLEPHDLVIADAERALAVAGVMGGAESEVTEATRDVLIESAQFHPTRIRRTARRLGLHSEASYRFERGVDPEGVARAADRAARLLAELCGGTVAPGRVETHGTPLPRSAEVRLDPARVNRLLGTDLAPARVAELLERADFAVRHEAQKLVAAVPSWRSDVHRPEDLVEEVARLHGYDRIPATLPEAPLRPALRPARLRALETLRNTLAGQGLLECVTLPFVSAADADRLGLAAGDRRRSSVGLANPLVEEESRLRTSLAPSLLRAARQNLDRQADEVRLFEISPVFLARGRGELPDEPLFAAGILTQAERPTLWQPRERIPLFFLAKSIAERAVFDLGYAPWCRPGDEGGSEPFLHPGVSVWIGVGDRVLGSIGELHPEAAAHFDLDVPCALFELDVTALLAAPGRARAFREPSRQPRVRRDVAVLLDRDRRAGEVLEAIRRAAGPELVSAEIFDRYEGAGVPEGKVSLAFRVTFQRQDRALTESEIAGRMERVVEVLSRGFGGQLRQS
jgi:phenylalanyl-tRNA synthetase beta chain